VTQFAVDRGRTSDPTVGLTLMNLNQIYARKIAGATDLVIEVNPRHVDYYRRFWFFEALTAPRPCPRVRGAPAVFMHLPLAIIDAYERGSMGAPGRTPLCLWYEAHEREAIVDNLGRAAMAAPFERVSA